MRGAAVVGNSDFKIARDSFIDEVFEKHGRDDRIDSDGYRAFLHAIEHIKEPVDDWPAKWKTEKDAISQGKAIEALEREHLVHLYDKHRWSKLGLDIGTFRGNRVQVNAMLREILFEKFDKDLDGVLPDEEYTAFLVGIGHTKSDPTSIEKVLIPEKAMPYYGKDGVSKLGFSELMIITGGSELQRTTY